MAATALAACDFEGSSPGVRGLCASPSADPVCDAERLETAEEGCWKLVQCGSIPVANYDDPDDPDDQDRFFDYNVCVDYLERRADRLDLMLACMSGASCDQLRFPGGPEEPTRNRPEMPSCLQFGEQP